MPLNELLDEAFGIKKPKVVENAVARVEKVIDTHAVDALVHGLGPKIIEDPGQLKIEEVVDFNFGDLADTSDFKRLIYLAITGKSWRGTNKRLDSTLKELLERIKAGL